MATGKNSVDDFTDAYLEFMGLVQDNPSQNYENEIILDCANGVGALPMILIKNRIREHVNIQLINTMTDDPTLLNEGCGAEFVHKDVKLPTGVSDSVCNKAASFDGDADRLIYFRI